MARNKPPSTSMMHLVIRAVVCFSFNATQRTCCIWPRQGNPCWDWDKNIKTFSCLIVWPGVKQSKRLTTSAGTGLLITRGSFWPNHSDASLSTHQINLIQFMQSMHQLLECKKIFVTSSISHPKRGLPFLFWWNDTDDILEQFCPKFRNCFPFQNIVVTECIFSCHETIL